MWSRSALPKTIWAGDLLQSWCGVFLYWRTAFIHLSLSTPLSFVRQSCSILSTTVGVCEVGTARGMVNIPLFQPGLDFTAHHLRASISRYVFRNIPGSERVPQNLDQALVIKIPRWGRHNSIPSRKSISHDQEIVPLEGEVVSHNHLERVLKTGRGNWESCWLSRCLLLRRSCMCLWS
jgi:hypothetical protein